MVEIFEPLEVRDSHSTRVKVQVGNDQNLVFDQNVVAFRGDGAICTLGDDLGLDTTGIIGGDDLNEYTWEAGYNTKFFLG